jgi:hypothetical protein
VFFNLSGCSPSDEPKELPSQNFLVDGKTFEVPEHIETEEELYDDLSKNHEKMLRRIRQAYLKRREALMVEKSTMKNIIEQSWWYYIGLHGIERDILRACDSELRSEYAEYKRKIQALDRRFNTFLRDLWLSIMKENEIQLLHRLTSTTICHHTLHNATEINGVMIRSFNSAIEINGEAISLLSTIHSRRGLKVYLGSIYRQKELTILEGLQNMSEADWKYPIGDWEVSRKILKLETLQLENKLLLLDVEHAFCIKQAWECIYPREKWRYETELRAEKENRFQMLCTKAKEDARRRKEICENTKHEIDNCFYNGLRKRCEAVFIKKVEESADDKEREIDSPRVIQKALEGYLSRSGFPFSTFRLLHG